MKNVKQFIAAGVMIGAVMLGNTNEPQQFESVERFEITSVNEHIIEALSTTDINKGIQYPVHVFDKHGANDLAEGDIIEVTWHEDAYTNGSMEYDFAEIDIIN